MKVRGGMRRQVYVAILALCFFLLALATTVARLAPATEFELDIYRATPVAFWILIGSTMLLSTTLAVSRFAYAKQNRAALGAVASSVLLVVALPLIRGHHHIGEADLLTHIGWVNELRAGIIEPIDLFYPSVLTLTAMVAEITTMPPERVFLVLSVVLVGLFVIFTSLVVRRLDAQRGSVTIAVFAALLLLQIDQVATHLQPLPRNATIYMAPFILFILLVFLHDNTTEVAVLSGVAFIAYLFTHPQFAVTIAIVLSTFLAAIFVLRYLGADGGYRIEPSGLLVTAFGLMTWLWIAKEDIFAGFLQTITHFLVIGAETGGEVASRASSLAAVGGGIGDLFLKIFLVPLIASLIVGLRGVSLLFKVYTRPSEMDSVDTFYLALLVGMSSLVPLMVVFLITDRRDYLFRYYGFMMSFLTVLFAIAATKLTSNLSSRVTHVLAPIFIIGLAVSMLVMFPSPYIYNDIEHAPDARMTGFETMFTYADPAENSYDHVRSGASRYGNAIMGPEYQPRSEYYEADRRRGGAPDHFNDHNLSAFYSDQTYLAVTNADIERDAEMYNGFRYSHDDFAYLESDSNISKIYANGDTDFYSIE